LAAASAPITPPAPALFSTMTVCFNTACRRWPSSRASASEVPPAADGTMMRTGLAGQAACGKVSVGAMPRAAMD